MATILDALIVTLGLDTSGYTRGVSEADKVGKKLADGQEANAKKSAEATKKASNEQLVQRKKEQEAAKKLADQYSSVRFEIMGMAAGIATIAGAGLAATIGGLSQLSAASHNLGMDAHELDAWHMSVKKMGGDPAEFDAFAAKVSKLKTDLKERHPDKEDSIFATELQKFGVNKDDLASGNMKNILSAIAKSQEGKNKSDIFNDLQTFLHLGPTMIQMLQDGKKGFEGLYDEADKLSQVTQKNVDEAQKADQAWNQFKSTIGQTGATIFTKLSPALTEGTKLLKDFNDAMASHPAETAAGTVVAGVGGVVAAKAAAKAVFGKAVSAVGGGAAEAGAGAAAVGETSLLGVAATGLMRWIGPAALMLHSGELNAGEDEKMNKMWAARDKSAKSGDTEDVAAIAKRLQDKYHVPASVQLAQYKLESNSGKRMPVGSNNPFGIKAKSGQAYVEAETNEFIDGRMQRVVQKFAKFDTIAEAFEAHAKLLATSPAYAGARAHADDPNAFADALTGKYATDPQYGSKLKSIMNSGKVPSLAPMIAAANRAMYGRPDKQASASNKIDTTINTLNVYANNAKDGTAIAASMKTALNNNGLITGAMTGMT